MKVAICDDELSSLMIIEEILHKYSAEKSVAIETECFKSPFDLLLRIEHGTGYDCIFLDVLMPGENGIDTAAEIRNYDKNVKIIFLTSSSEYAVQSYQVKAFYYQLKPVRETELFNLMDFVCSEYVSEAGRSLILHCKNAIVRVPVQDIEYCEVIRRTVYVHLTDGSVLESIQSLNDFYQELCHFGGFLRPHRSYLVNLSYIKFLSYRSMIMNCDTEIPISRGKYTQIKDSFLQHAFANKKVMV